MYDVHLHLQDERFATCRTAVLRAAVAAGITGGCCCGCAPRDWPDVADLAAAGAPALAGFRLLPAFGVHPWYAGELPADWLTRLEELLVHHPGAPLGEIGLDGLREHPPRAEQRRVLTLQLELAARLRRPVVLHGARAWGELLETLRPMASRLPGLVAHAFGGSADIQRGFLALGGHLSFAGTVCNPAARNVRAAALATPAEQLLIETDAPDLLPHTAEPPAEPPASDPAIPAGINHPARLVTIAATLAALRGIPVAELATHTTNNARQLFALPQNSTL
jgi:TatD DNase family protein